jgi:hypothetical protein
VKKKDEMKDDLAVHGSGGVILFSRQKSIQKGVGTNGSEPPLFIQGV